MKKLFLVLSLAMMATTAYADLQGAPFSPEADARFNAIEQGSHISTASPGGSADGHQVRQIVKATYDFAKHGGGSTLPIDLGVSIPANSIETRTYLYSITKPTTSASGTLAFYCASSGNADLLQPLAAASFPAAGAVRDGTQTGAASNFSTVSTQCKINAKIATGALTAGKVVIYVEYVVHQ